MHSLGWTTYHLVDVGNQTEAEEDTGELFFSQLYLWIVFVNCISWLYFWTVFNCIFQLYLSIMHFLGLTTNHPVHAGNQTEAEEEIYPIGKNYKGEQSCKINSQIWIHVKNTMPKAKKLGFIDGGICWFRCLLC